MAASVSLSTMRTRVRRKADIEGDTTRFPDAELTAYINEELLVLHGQLVEAYPDDYRITSSALSVSSGSPTQALPADFFKLRGLDVTIDGEVVSLDPYRFDQRNDYVENPGWSLGVRPRYKISGSVIRFLPAPLASYSGTIWYAPTMTALSADGDTFDGVNGWEEMAVIAAAIKVLRKDDRPTGELERDLARFASQLSGVIKSRDLAQPKRVVDVRGRGTRNEPGEWPR